jgi:hypothetical protein
MPTKRVDRVSAVDGSGGKQKGASRCAGHATGVIVEHPLVSAQNCRCWGANPKLAPKVEIRSLQWPNTARLKILCAVVASFSTLDSRRVDFRSSKGP